MNISNFRHRSAIALGTIVLGCSLAGTAAAQYNVTVWSGTGSGSAGDATQQALPTNPLVTPSDQIATFSYTGSVNWLQSGGSANTLDQFVANGGGTISGCVGSACASGMCPDVMAEVRAAVTGPHWLLSIITMSAPAARALDAAVASLYPASAIAPAPRSSVRATPRNPS